MKYPKTRKKEVTDSYFDTKVSENYRWLENDMSEETAEWVKTQNEFTQNYLSKIPFRNSIKEKLQNLWNFEKLLIPFQRGEYLYYFKNDGLQNQNILYRKKENSEEEIFLNPNTFSTEGTDTLDVFRFSNDNSFMAYSVSEKGSDWNKIYILNVETKTLLDEVLIDIKHSNISWKGNLGFYYSTFERKTENKFSAKSDFKKLYFHVLNTQQSEDKIIYGKHKNEQYLLLYSQITKDERYLSLLQGTSGKLDLLIKDLQNPLAGYKTIIKEANTYLIENIGSTLYLFTNENAPNNRLVKVDYRNPAIENWQDIIPETENVLNISKAGGYFFAHYTKDVNNHIIQYDYEGNLINEIELPGLGTANGFNGEKEDEKVYYSFTNNITPSSIYCYNLQTMKSELYWKPKIDFNTENYETKQVFYTSKDGTKVPMNISYKKGTKLNGKSPTILYGYGGFKASILPFFSILRAIWMEMGGIYAIANIRGGDEYGEKWYKAGTQLQKQNVFDDFIAAAEYLIEEKYTSSDFLAIHGASNGGLLVGAVMLQRPKLFKVVLPAVGVLDMLRYHKFTIGAAWSSDYGTAEQSKEMFEYIYKYSPLHNVKEEEYPATIITTSDHDDRVVPAHSFKFGAELQAKQQGENPILIRIDTNAGHGAGKATNKIIDEFSDVYAFALFNMGIEEI